MQFGDFKLSIIRECTFRLDGGAMYGVVPFSLWSKLSQPDVENRILLATNLLLIESSHGRVLVETGMGNRWTESERQRYQIQSHIDHANICGSAGLANHDIEHVIMSHLHFDHAGGACLMIGDQLVPAFPRAKYYVQAGEWQLAHSQSPRVRGSYRRDDFEPLKQHGLLALIEGDQEIIPGVSVAVTGGHTGYHQIVTFTSGGLTGVYFADIVPTRHHLNPAWVMGYDHFPLSSCDAKAHWLDKACKEKWLVVFDHEPSVPWGNLEQNQAGRFNFLPLAGDVN